jgi:GTPase SAR1 family protein
MPFGQVVVGPPGSGKTTYCNGVQQLLRGAQQRVAVVNLDPANTAPPYRPDIDICDLVCLDEVMQELGLGPNGGLAYCIDYLETNLDWLVQKMKPHADAGAYFVFDCPGQVELFTQHGSLKHILDALTRDADYRLAVVHFIDSHLCTEPAKYIAALLLALSAMLHMDLPHVNVLSKVDLLPQYGELDFSLDFYTEVQDLSYLVHAMERGRFGARHRKLSSMLCELVQDFGLVSFHPLAIEDKASLLAVLGQVDKANGAAFAAALATPIAL